MVADWADHNISKDRTFGNAFTKLMSEEIPEFIEDPTPEEWADVAIIWLDIAHLRGINPAKAIMDKMMVNMNDREFEFNPELGVYKHKNPAVKERNQRAE